ncbi:MAG TPA: hypothetical protein VFS43_25200 [Polyangiaceae bacterium]|nr:hypothetical protein [Polyangiaceae bacterium]
MAWLASKPREGTFTMPQAPFHSPSNGSMPARASSRRATSSASEKASLVRKAWTVNSRRAWASSAST